MIEEFLQLYLILMYVVLESVLVCRIWAINNENNCFHVTWVFFYKQRVNMSKPEGFLDLRSTTIQMGNNTRSSRKNLIQVLILFHVICMWANCVASWWIMWKQVIGRGVKGENRGPLHSHCRWSFWMHLPPCSGVLSKSSARGGHLKCRLFSKHV